MCSVISFSLNHCFGKLLCFMEELPFGVWYLCSCCSSCLFIHHIVFQLKEIYIYTPIVVTISLNDKPDKLVHDFKVCTVGLIAPFKTFVSLIFVI